MKYCPAKVLPSRLRQRPQDQCRPGGLLHQMPLLVLARVVMLPLPRLEQCLSRQTAHPLPLARFLQQRPLQHRRPLPLRPLTHLAHRLVQRLHHLPLRHLLVSPSAPYRASLVVHRAGLRDRLPFRRRPPVANRAALPPRPDVATYANLAPPLLLSVRPWGPLMGRDFGPRHGHLRQELLRLHLLLLHASPRRRHSPQSLRHLLLVVVPALVPRLLLLSTAPPVTLRLLLVPPVLTPCCRPAYLAKAVRRSGKYPHSLSAPPRLRPGRATWTRRNFPMSAAACCS
mmetsp:Transcript_7144/g.17333  ORF Transcript_7144/g.17333 Transcript_7144/m.17333 type:complete len:285 (-) Transcript_7144:2107-2961(-)